MKPVYCILFSIFISSPAFSQKFVRSELPTEVNVPWEIVYGPDDFLWITEAGGKVSRIDPINGNKTIIYTAPDYFGGSEQEKSPLCPNLSIGAGTFGMALHPDFTNENTSFLYFLYSYNSGTEAAPATKFRIKRLTWNANTNTVENDTNIVNMITTGYDHLGGRLMAVKQNGIPYLFVSIGDNGRSEDTSPECYNPQSNNPNNFAQDISTQNGKIHRFHMDGSIPADNPIAENSFYTRGHRNPQGLMYNDNLDILYAIEHGDQTDDEINVLQKGMNYGWKDVRGYHNDDNYPGEAEYIANYTAHPQIPNDALIEPLYAWCNTPPTSDNYTDWCTVAPSGGIYYGSDAIPEWTNSLLVVTLKDGLSTDKEVFQFKLQANGDLVPSTPDNPNPKKFFGTDQDLNGRLRDIAISNDGKTIYLVNNGGTTADKITVYQLDTESSIVNNGNTKLDIQLYPNPANQIITIKGIENILDIKEVSITSLLGKTTQVVVDKNAGINVSNLANGIYYLNLISDNQTYTLKFVKN